jgi:peptide/nickel transport system permease protein
MQFRELIQMKRHILNRLFSSLVVLFLICLLTFILIRLIPGDPIQASLHQNVDLTDSRVAEEIRALHGLDRPIPAQFITWLRNLLQGDWGKSLQTGESVLAMFWRRLPVTIELFIGATLWTWAIGFPLGVIGALRRNTFWDVSLTSAAILGISIPSFWEGILFIYLLAVVCQIFPPSGFTPFFEDSWMNLKSLFLPTLVMGTHSADLWARYNRSSLLESIGQDYVRTARAKRGIRGIQYPIDRGATDDCFGLGGQNQVSVFKSNLSPSISAAFFANGPSSWGIHKIVHGDGNPRESFPQSPVFGYTGDVHFHR